MYPADSSEQRREMRVNSELQIQVSIGSQLTIQGQLKDLSLKSAFIRVRNSVFIKTGDEVGFVIQCSEHEDDVVRGLAYISRIVPGEGFALYFTRISEASLRRLSKLL